MLVLSGHLTPTVIYWEKQTFKVWGWLENCLCWDNTNDLTRTDTVFIVAHYTTTRSKLFSTLSISILKAGASNRRLKSQLQRWHVTGRGMWRTGWWWNYVEDGVSKQPQEQWSQRGNKRATHHKRWLRRHFHPSSWTVQPAPQVSGMELEDPV